MGWIVSNFERVYVDDVKPWEVVEDIPQEDYKPQEYYDKLSETWANEIKKIRRCDGCKYLVKSSDGTRFCKGFYYNGYSLTQDDEELRNIQDINDEDCALELESEVFK